ncbi:MAG TPA: caspase family protein [Polyangia bacterium]|jgi:hypothetical protein
MNDGYRRWFGALALLSSLGWPSGAKAADPSPTTTAAPSLAVVVGTNQGGPGQTELRFAEDDARAVATVLGTLGRYQPANVQLLLRPSLKTVEQALDGLAARAQEAKRQGEQVQVLFYYSGHARASALNLGDEEFPLGDLRARLLSLPATVTVVLLDACQSGAISRVKGAEPTADFSYNSVSRLDNAGIAVMASSTGTELSQESETLRSSFFTHHLLVGLRGAGDTDGDGRVTLGEAYRYAYNQTLAATAATAVGSQHATLETGLRGKGEVVLSYPSAANARMELPATLGGELLVRLEPPGTVMAEMHKAPGHLLRLALSPGRYVAIHREGGRVRRCELALAEGQTAILNVAGCADVAPAVVAAKGGEGEVLPPRDRWIFLAAMGGATARHDRFVSRLGDFGFQDQVYFGLPRFSLAVAHAVRRHLAFGVELGSLDERVFRRQSSTTLSGQDERFWWSTYALGLFVESDYPLWRDHLIPYLRGGLGVTFARTSYQESDADTHAVVSDATTSDFGYVLRAAAGVAVMPWRHFGFYGEGTATFAPTVDNLLGDTHDSGGFGVLLGLRGAL